MTVVDGQQHDQYSDHGLSASHIPLQQSIHLSAASQISSNLFDHPLLRTGELKRKMMLIEIVETIPDTFKYDPFGVTMPLGAKQIHAHLCHKKFFELDSMHGSLKVSDIRRKMYLIECGPT